MYETLRARPNVRLFMYDEQNSNLGRSKLDTEVIIIY